MDETGPFVETYSVEKPYGKAKKITLSLASEKLD